MPSRADTKPCPNCGKPIKQQASNCWFCGDVFDTEPCPHCDAPVKKTSSHCGFCGQAFHATRTPDPLPSDAIQSTPPTTSQSVAPRRQEAAPMQDCPRCGEEIPLAAVKCKYCGALLDTDELGRPGRAPRWEVGPVRGAHRGGTILGLAIVSFFCCVLLAPIAVAMAVSDLRSMRGGSMDPTGETLTWAGLVIGVLVIILFVVGIALQMALGVTDLGMR